MLGSWDCGIQKAKRLENRSLSYKSHTLGRGFDSIKLNNPNFKIFLASVDRLRTMAHMNRNLVTLIQEMRPTIRRPK